MDLLIRFCPSGVVNASESMPFRLPARCGAVTRSGAQCAINAGSALRDSSGRLASEPLRRGGPHCMFHMSLFETKAAAVCGDVLVFYIDFETTGLDVLAAEVLEIGVTEARGRSLTCVRSRGVTGGARSFTHLCSLAPSMLSARVRGAFVRSVRHNGVTGADP